MKNILLPLLFVISSVSQSVCAQDVRTSTISWSSGKNVNNADNATTGFVCSFVSHADQKVDWNQRNGAYVTSYTVTSVDGSWTNASADGQVVYHVTSGQLAGTITFSRLNGNTTVRMSLSLNGKPNFDFTFLIDSITAQ
jgi:hypothetical protein